MKKILILSTLVFSLTTTGADINGKKRGSKPCPKSISRTALNAIDENQYPQNFPNGAVSIILNGEAGPVLQDSILSFQVPLDASLSGKPRSVSFGIHGSKLKRETETSCTYELNLSSKDQQQGSSFSVTFDKI